MTQRIHLFVTGKVQKVFFRQTLKAMAQKNNVSGWVKNLTDGRVEAILEGEDVDVNRVVEWAHAGPTNALVKDVEIRNESYVGEFSTFDILY